MLMLDAISAHQLRTPNHIYTVRAQINLNDSGFLCGSNYKRWAFRRWNHFQIPNMDKSNKLDGIELKKQRVVVVKAVATLEPRYLATQINGQNRKNIEVDIKFGSEVVVGFDEREYLGGEESEEVSEKEKLRRMRISKANKGNTPWNKGRKHSVGSSFSRLGNQKASTQTLKRIKERTRIAMQSPKVKMKLINLGHAQSKETRVKIGVGVRAGWERRRERLKLQETCFVEWQNLIAEAGRRGTASERVLQWDSYKILDKELENEWVESIEKRKKTPRPKGNKRAPKSPEQRRKISEAISAKWADAGYRDRVCSALSKYYGAPVGTGQKPKKRPIGVPKVRTTTKKKGKDTTDKLSLTDLVPPKKKSKMPTFKDPFASSKLEMIKSIRAQRAVSELKKTEAFEQAKVLICEAERAAKALEASAMRSPLAQASLLESRELIAQAIESLNSIESGHINNFVENVVDPLINTEGNSHGTSLIDKEKRVNGFGTSNLIGLTGIDSRDEMDFNDLSYAVEEKNVVSLSDFEIGEEQFATNFTGQQLRDQLVRLNGKLNNNELVQNGNQVVDSKTAAKKWVRGRLVESAEGLD